MDEPFGSPRGGTSKAKRRPPPGASPGPRGKSTTASMKEASTRLLIDPRTSSWIGRWDAVTSVALIFVAFVTPFEVALLDVGLDALFFINRIVDCVFIIDMLFCFVTVYTNALDVWITDPTAIAVHYLKGWFPIDLVSVGISGIDVYVVISERVAAQSVAKADDGDDTLNSLRTLRIVRVLRFFRVVKLVRLVRAARIFARWENKIAINYNTLQLVKSVTAAVVVSHWIACMWITQAFMQGDMAPMSVGGGSGSWLQDSYPYCYTSAAPKGYDCREPGLLYVASLYHTTLCLFGGLEATPGNGMEMLMGTFLMLLSGLVWSHVMATVIDVVTVSDPEESAFRSTMDSLNTYASLSPRHALVAARLEALAKPASFSYEGTINSLSLARSLALSLSLSRSLSPSLSLVPTTPWRLTRCFTAWLFTYSSPTPRLFPAGTCGGSASPPASAAEPANTSTSPSTCAPPRRVGSSLISCRGR